jgi:hypothetical protein
MSVQQETVTGGRDAGVHGYCVRAAYHRGAASSKILLRAPDRRLLAGSLVLLTLLLVMMQFRFLFL